MDAKHPTGTMLRRFFRARQARIDQFVAEHSGNPKQRSDGWLAAKNDKIGGSELATLMGWNPYSTPTKLMARKVGIDTWDGAGAACWWGTMFEAISERMVEMDCQTRVQGSDIHVDGGTLIPDHANSPDGYCALMLTRAGEESPWTVCFDLDEAQREAQEVICAGALLEFKAPYSRLPKGAMPRQYLPQVWSGTGLCPEVELGLYVDVVYRLCTLHQLGPGPEYARGYHHKDQPAAEKQRKEWLWEGPHAWGVSAIYAPIPGRRASLCAGPLPAGNAFDPDKNADILCHSLWVREMRCGGMSGLGEELLDIGEIADLQPKQFNTILGLINAGQLHGTHGDPVCGGPDAAAQLAARFQQLEAPEACPENHYLLGFLPWKVQEVSYTIVPQDPDFLVEMEPVVREFMETARRLRAADDVPRAYQEWAQNTMVPVSAETQLKKSGLSDNDLLNCFELVRDCSYPEPQSESPPSRLGDAVDENKVAGAGTDPDGSRVSGSPY